VPPEASTELSRWDFRNGQLVKIARVEIGPRPYRVSGVNCVSGDGGLIILSVLSPNGWLLDLRKADDLDRLRTLVLPSNMGVSTCICTPGNRLIVVEATGRLSDIKMLDASDGHVVGVFAGSAGEVLMRMSKEGDLIYTVNSRQGISVWDVESRTRLATTYLMGEKDRVTIAPDGRFDGTPNGIEQLYLVQGLEVLPLESFHERYYTPNLLRRAIQTRGLEPLPDEPMSAPIPSLFSQGAVRLPPIVSIEEPANGSTVANAEQNVVVSVAIRDGGLDEVRLYLNDKLVADATRGLQVKAASPTVSRRFIVTLSPGENRLRAVALSKDRVESTPARVTVHHTGERTKPNLHVIAVGINTYRNSRYNLNYGKADALAFAQALAAGGKAIFQSVRVTCMHDADATRERVLRELQTAATASHPSDVFVLFYAGHGVMSIPTGTERPEFYFALHGVKRLYGDLEELRAQGVSGSELRTALRKIPAQKQFIVLDACQSGAMVETLAMRGAAEEKALVQLARSTGVVLLTSSGSQQFASEVKALGHGLFTHSILTGLGGAADGGSRDGKITVKELCAYVEDAVPGLAEKHRGQAQFPMSWCIGRDFPLGLNR
jgi:hypothetical protein